MNEQRVGADITENDGRILLQCLDRVRKFHRSHMVLDHINLVTARFERGFEERIAFVKGRGRKGVEALGVHGGGEPRLSRDQYFARHTFPHSYASAGITARSEAAHSGLQRPNLRISFTGLDFAEVPRYVQ